MFWIVPRYTRNLVYPSVSECARVLKTPCIGGMVIPPLNRESLLMAIFKPPIYYCRFFVECITWTYQEVRINGERINGLVITYL